MYSVAGKNGVTPLGDLATVVCSYDTTKGTLLKYADWQLLCCESKQSVHKHKRRLLVQCAGFLLSRPGLALSAARFSGLALACMCTRALSPRKYNCWLFWLILYDRSRSRLCMTGFPLACMCYASASVKAGNLLYSLLSCEGPEWSELGRELWSEQSVRCTHLNH